MSNNYNTNDQLEINDQVFSYLSDQRKYLQISAIVPIFVIFVQLVNLIFFLFIAPVPHRHMVLPRRANFQELLTPSIILIVLSIFALFKLIFMRNLLNKLERYQNKVKSKKTNSDIDNISMTKIFYDLVSYMEKTRIVFLLINFISLLYIYWILTFFLFQIGLIPVPTIPIRNFILLWLNLIMQAALIFYLIYEWSYYFHWNKKLKVLRDFEQKIWGELGLEDNLFEEP